MNRLLAWTATVLTVASLGVATATSAQAAVVPPPYCEITWGSQPRTGGDLSVPPLTGVRAGRHSCFDRLVLDISGPTSGFDVRYVAAVRDQGAGQVVPLRGGAFLEIVLRNPAYDHTGAPTYHPADRGELVSVAGWRTFRQVASGGSFEGYTTIGLGVRARLPFQVFTLDGPGGNSRVVIDVAHRW